MKFKEWLTEWLNTYKKPYVKTYKHIERNIVLHIPSVLKNKDIKDVTAIDCQKCINNCNLSRTRLELFDIFHGAFLMAYRLGIVQKDISTLLVKPKHIRVIGQALTNEEVKDFTSKIQKSRYYYVYMFYLLTGCRRAEALSLTINDIDYKNEVIHIKGTKTADSDRFLPLFPELKTLLAQVKPKDERLFPFNANRLSRTFKSICPNHKLHDLRHTFATRCLECNISIKVVQKWLGHTRLDTTASIYSHCQPEFMRTEATKFHLQ